LFRSCKKKKGAYVSTRLPAQVFAWKFVPSLYNKSMRTLGLFSSLRPPIEVVIDFEPRYIKSVILEISSKGGNPRVVKKGVFHLPHNLKTERVLEKLREVLFSTVKMLGRVPAKITLGLDVHFGEQEILQWNFPLPKDIKSLSARELGNYFYTLFEERRAKETASIAYPLDVSANGYSIKESIASGIKTLPPRSFSPQQASFQSLVISFPKTVGNHLLDTRKSLGGLPIDFVPLVAAYQYAFVKGLNQTDAFLISVTRDSTLLMLIQEKELKRFTCFPVGTKHFIHGIAKEFSLSSEEARDLKKQYAKGIIDEATKARLQKFLAQEVVVWQKKFIDALEVFYSYGPIPPQVFILGEGTHLPELVDFIKNTNWIKDFSYVSNPSARVVDPSAIFGGNTLGGTLEEPNDMNLAALMFYSLHHKPLF